MCRKQEIEIEEFLQVDIGVLYIHARQHLMKMGVLGSYYIKDVGEISCVADEFENGG